MGDRLKNLFSTNGIPVLFWYTVSFCMFAITIMLCWVFYHSQSVSFEVANTRIEMVNNVFQIEQVVSLLKKKEAEIEESKKKIEQLTNNLNTEIEKINKMPNRTEPELSTLDVIKDRDVSHMTATLVDITRSLHTIKQQPQFRQVIKDNE